MCRAAGISPKYAEYLLFQTSILYHGVAEDRKTAHNKELEIFYIRLFSWRRRRRRSGESTESEGILPDI